MEIKEKLWVYDEETYPNFFSYTVSNLATGKTWGFEVSERKNQIDRIFACLDHVRDTGGYKVGFNNLGFDYPVIHKVLENRNKLPKDGKKLAALIYEYAQEQIASFKGEFGHTINHEQHYCKQLDLYKIHHFDNKAKATGLKLIEFNMRSESIEDLPFPVGTVLTPDQMDIVLLYNAHDVSETSKFCLKSLPMIEFRLQLTDKYSRNFNNHNDTKIGKDYFIMKLEEAGIPTKIYKNSRLVMNQSVRKNIPIKDCLFKYYDFQRPEFQAVLKWFDSQVIEETKGVFSDLTEEELGEVAQYAEMEVKRKKLTSKEAIPAFLKLHPSGWIEEEVLAGLENKLDEDGFQVYEEVIVKGKVKKKKAKVNKISYYGCHNFATTLNVVVDGFRFDFGTGGIHGSLSCKVARATSKYEIIDADVASMYPNLAISNNVYPEHLTNKFCDIYKDVYEQRKSFAKGTVENAMLKLALNGVYGDSNNKFGPFYDPKYTMTITINGQLSLCLLAEKLLTIPNLKLIQVNTDGVTVACPREHRKEYDRICAEWQKQVKLDLEFAEYSKMIIRDVNNYIALYTNGKVKRKGAYQYEDLGWHQNQGGLVIPMAAEAKMLYGTDIREFVENHKEKFDFMLRTKVPRSSKLLLVSDDGTEVQIQNTCRYYPSKSGGKLVKVMPALPDDELQEERYFGIDKDWNVKPCNNMKDFEWDIDYDYYVKEAEKLVIE
jgi:hypothetical protein